MPDLDEQVDSFLLESRLWEPGESLLVAVSGGVDSMVLLDLLRRHARVHGQTLRVAHFNHQLRGMASRADERLVREVAKDCGLPLHAGRANVRNWARREGVSLEMAARHLRHTFLARTAARLAIRRIALAHHADDQVELFFLRLFRGAGPEGLSGMKPLSASPVNRQIQLIRPLLGIRRSEIEAYAKRHRIRFRTDISNRDVRFDRNRIRNELLPLLRAEYQPAIDAIVLRTMDLLAAEGDVVESVAGCSEATPFEQKLPAVQRRALKAQLMERGVVPDSRLIEALRKGGERRHALSPEREVWRDQAGQVLVKAIRRDEPMQREQVINLQAPAGEASFAGARFRWRLRPWKGWAAVRQGVGVEHFDADKVGAWLRLRHWQPGDRYQPLGMNCPVRVQNLFVNAKIPRPKRSQLVLVERVGGPLIWIEGLRISEGVKVDETTRRVLEWRVEREAWPD